MYNSLLVSSLSLRPDQEDWQSLIYNIV
jgi:hypothetical protein